jgi:DegV family protein with EDD domain
MMRVAVVTDSASDVAPTSLGPDVTVVELEPIQPPGELDLPGRGAATAVRVSGGTLTGTFVEKYERLARQCDAILSIHSSARLSEAYEAARAAREELRGVLPIEVVDTGAASIQLGFVVRRVARLARRGADLAALELLARRASSNVHAMFFAESVDYLNREARWARSRAWPISGNGTRPLLQVEDGEVCPLERVRTRARGYDRLAEFVELFPHVEELAVMHDAPLHELELVLRRLELLYPRDRITIGAYGPTLRAQLGPHAIGVFVDQGFGAD